MLINKTWHWLSLCAAFECNVGVWGRWACKLFLSLIILPIIQNKCRIWNLNFIMNEITAVSLAVCCIEHAWHLYCHCRYCSTFEIHGDFLVFLLIAEQRIYGEIYTPTAEHVFISMDNSTRQLHVNFGYISLGVVNCTVCS